MPLHKDKRRFEVALFHMLTRTRLKGQAAKAGELAASVLHAQTIPELIMDDRGASVGIRFDFIGGFTEDARTNRGWKIVREAPGLIADATDGDLVWLEMSAQLLDVAMNAVALGDVRLLHDTLVTLDQFGWRKPLARLFRLFRSA